MINKYAKAYTEVLEILSYFPQEEYNKIPKEKIEFYTHNMDKNYKFSINPDVDLSSQYISKEANAILVSLFIDYFATEKQNDILKNVLRKNQEYVEKIKKEKYNLDNIFNDKDSNIKINKLKNEEQLPTEYKEPLWKKILNIILKKIKLK